MTRPHGQVGKAYRKTFVLLLGIIVAVIILHGAYLELMGHGYAGVMPESMLRFGK